MKYISTAGKAREASLLEAVRRGVDPAGGLYMPESIPRLPKAFFANIEAMDLHDIAYVVAYSLFGNDIDSASLRSLVTETLNFEIPLKRIGDDRYVFELFHGPSLSFKDVGCRFMAKLVGWLNSKGAGCRNILTASTGDTGGAVACGFHDLEGVDVYILYPAGRLNHINEAQFTTLGGNIHPIAVNGDFDDCVRLVKRALADEQLVGQCGLLTANSINIARLLPQTFYFFHAYACLLRLSGRHLDDIVISIPSGNLGHLTAGVIARRMGLPIKRLVGANNSNGALEAFMQAGRLPSRKAVATVAPVLDVSDPSNLPRLIDLYDGNIDAMRRDIEAFSVADADITATIARVASRHGYILDPHAATAWNALDASLQPGETGVVFATAHPGKFHDTVTETIGSSMSLPPQLKDAMKRRRHADRIAPHYQALSQYLRQKAT